MKAVLFREFDEPEKPTIEKIADPTRRIGSLLCKAY